MPMPTLPRWDRLAAKGKTIGVDREAKVIRGYVVAEEGPFKTPGRGEFDRDGLRKIVELMAARPAGTKSRFAHPGLSADGIGTFLGRAKNPRLDATGEKQKVRADLHLDPSSFSSPSGNLGQYVLDLAESDPEAFGSSLVLQVDKLFRLEPNGTPKVDAEGNELPPLWMPTRIHASDIVDEGDAVHGGFLSAGLDVEGLSDAVLWEGSALLDQLFAGQERAAVEARCREFLARYLDRRYGPVDHPGDHLDLEDLRRRARLLTLSSPAS